MGAANNSARVFRPRQAAREEIILLSRNHSTLGPEIDPTLIADGDVFGFACVDESETDQGEHN